MYIFVYVYIYIYIYLHIIYIYIYNSNILPNMEQRQQIIYYSELHAHGIIR